MLKNALYPAVGLVYISNGMQVVLLAWLGLSVLALSPIQLGAVMAAMILPQVLLLPIAGKYADYFAPANLAKFGCSGLSLCHIGLVAVLHITPLNVLMLTIYAAVVGVNMAVFLPAKDKAALQVLPNRMQKALSLSSAFQFAGVALGTLIASFVDEIGITSVLITQFLLCALAAMYWGLLGKSVAPLMECKPQNVSLHSMQADYLNGVAVLQQHKALKQLLLLCAFNGFMQMGFAIVLFPVLGISYWGFSGSQYALMQASFSVGAVVIYVANAYRKPQQYPGQAALFCLLYTAAIIFAITRDPTFMGRFGLIFLWGAVVGYSASMSRVLMHSIVPDEVRGRAAALYQMVLLGLAPLGSMVCGVLIHYFSIAQALWSMLIASLVIFVLFLFSRELWSVKQQPLVPSAAG